MYESDTIDEQSPKLLDALSKTLGPQFGQEALVTASIHTGGGVYVAAVDLAIDGRFSGRQLWLTRDSENTWLLGVYDFSIDEEDEGEAFPLYFPRLADNPHFVAERVLGLLVRLGVTELQGA